MCDLCKKVLLFHPVPDHSEVSRKPCAAHEELHFVLIVPDDPHQIISAHYLTQVLACVFIEVVHQDAETVQHTRELALCRDYIILACRDDVLIQLPELAVRIREDTVHISFHYLRHADRLLYHFRELIINIDIYYHRLSLEFISVVSVDPLDLLSYRLFYLCRSRKLVLCGYVTAYYLSYIFFTVFQRMHAEPLLEMLYIISHS